MDPSTLLLTSIDAALKAGEILKRGFGTTYNISSKVGRQNLVTDYDHLSEKSIIEDILKRHPSHGFLSEETGASGKKEPEVLWVIDPLDGTVNFAHTIPIFSVSIAAAINNEVTCGVVYNPMMNELFTAIKGGGSYLNGTKLKVSTTNKIEDAMMTTGFPYNVDEDPLHCIEHFSAMLKLGIPLRRLGSAALDLCYVAAGRFDAFWEVTLQPWDVAAGKLILEEAGGKVTHYDGKARDLFSKDTVLATNSLLHKAMMATLKI